MRIRKLFHNGNKKAFNVSYDDGVVPDIRFVNFLNKYGIIGTFNINSGLALSEFAWQHNNGMVICRLSKEQLIYIYDGHEIASHTLTHPLVTGMDNEAVMKELLGYEIKGFEYPYGPYDELTRVCKRSWF